MPADEVSLYNVALDAVGSRSSVSSVAEASREAEVCRLWYPKVRDLVLHAAHWNSARAFARLAVFRERDDTLEWNNAIDPPPGYRFAYTSPADLLRPQFLTTYGRFQTGVIDTTKVVLANEASSILAYTRRLENPALWEHDLYMAVGMALAAFICWPLTGKRSVAKDRQEQANTLLLQARTNNANDESNQQDTIPDWIAVRGSAYGAPSTRFYYPFGPMISITEMAAVS